MGPKIVIIGGGIGGLTARDSLFRAAPLSLQLRQLDFVMGRPAHA
jgi:NADH dehydrogenase FAD-containing subunit